MNKLNTFRIGKGLDIPISGNPQLLVEEKNVTKVALLGADYNGLRPDFKVQVGERVKLGQTLFCDKKSPSLCHTSPASGIVEAIHRGEKRALLSVVVAIDHEETFEIFASYTDSELDDLSEQQVRENLLQSGLWTAFRTRPYSQTPLPDSTPHSIFINAMDSNPLAVDPAFVITQSAEDFVNGIRVLARLGSRKTYLCHAAQSEIPYPELKNLHVQTFSGPHPAGLSGTHVHFLDPVHKNKTVWTINYQDVIAIGKLFISGALWVERMISLAGPMIKQPRLLRTRIGANIHELTHSGLISTSSRVISGSPLYGYRVSDATAFLGRYHLQVSALPEDREQQFMGWANPGKNKFSFLNVFTSKLFKNHHIGFSTSTNGEARAMVPVGVYEDVMPLDLLPTHLLRALIVKDTETAQALGCLELDEEDLALCTFVCPGKYDYGVLLRECLTRIEKEG